MSTASLLVGVAVAALAFVAGLRWSRARVSLPVPPLDESPSVQPAEEPPPAIDVEVVDTDQLLGRLSQAVDQIDQGVIVRDAHGIDLFRNRVARTYLEARDGLVLVEAAVNDLLAEALGGRTTRREVDLFGPPAQSFVVTAYPFTGGAGPGGLALIEDRSLQKLTETVRRDFVANISHQHKTPIGALGLLAETIRDEPDPEVVARLAERMITEADRAGCTVDDLLELSRIEFGDDAELAEVAMLAVIEEAIGRITAAAEHAGVGLLVDVDPELRLVGDRRQLVSALFNLLDNAVKYSPEESEIVIAAVRELPEGPLRLTVTDSGVGIPRRDLDRIFERFYRVDRARSRGTGGTGLGLAIVRHVASNHGGVVTVESIEGVGTSFTLVLPCAASSVCDAPTPVFEP